MKITITTKTTSDYTDWSKVKDADLPVGTEITETLKDGTIVVFHVAALNVYGAKKAILCKGCTMPDAPMNSTWTNEGGWDASRMRNVTMKEILKLLPDDLRAAIVERQITQRLRGKTVTSHDLIWLPSLMEITGRECEADVGDVHFPLFMTERDRVKENADGETVYWWLRSPLPSTAAFYCVLASGSSNSSYASGACGVAFGFLL